MAKAANEVTRKPARGDKKTSAPKRSSEIEVKAGAPEEPPPRVFPELERAFESFLSRRWPRLSGRVATQEVGIVLRRKSLAVSDHLVPAVGGGNQARVEHFAQARDQSRQRIAEIPVLATAEPVPRHHHAASKDSD